MVKKTKAAEMEIATKEITMFSKELEEKLKKFKSILDIPENLWEKVEKLYSRLCRIDTLFARIENVTIGMRKAQILFKIFPKPKEFAKTYKRLEKLCDALDIDTIEVDK